MKKYPGILSARFLIEQHSEMREAELGVWVPARPSLCPTFFERMRATWLVLTGKADAVIWEGGQ